MKTGRPSLRQAVLAAMPGTRAQLTKKAGVGSATVGKWLAILRAENVVRVAKWKRSKNGAKQPIFELGDAPDAKPPKTLTNAQSSARFRRRHPERQKEIKATHYRRAQVRERGHGFLATLFF